MDARRQYIAMFEAEFRRELSKPARGPVTRGQLLFDRWYVRLAEELALRFSQTGLSIDTLDEDPFAGFYAEIGKGNVPLEELSDAENAAIAEYARLPFRGRFGALTPAA